MLIKSFSPKSLPPKQYSQLGILVLTLLGLGLLNVLHADIVYLVLAGLAGAFCVLREKIRFRLANHRILSTLMLSGFFLFLFCTEFAGTAHAVWLDSIETWMTGAFPDASDLATLIFNVLRGFYVIYLIISGIQVFIALRRQEGLWEAAQLPLISLLIIGVIDIVAGFIVTSTMSICQICFCQRF